MSKPELRTSSPVLRIPDDIHITVERALAEDVGSGDLTAGLLPDNQIAKATVICRETAVVCGIPWFTEVYRQLDPGFQLDWQVKDGETLQPDQTVCLLQGNVRTLLTGERTALNFLQLLSGTASLTRDYLQLIDGTNAQLLDTRKTLPGLRTAQKYAVVCGGGKNHRMGLYDAILIKENHIQAAGSIAGAMQQARSIHNNIEIEVESLAELDEALECGAEQILLDNFELADLRKAVKLNAGKASLEASGGVNRETIRKIAETGVDFISVGGLTKDVKAVD
ncbi:MAG: carboxylating nicotinate-nucleotide diphosphorylase, partial [Gammaproteobacteria bacterium]